MVEMTRTRISILRGRCARCLIFSRYSAYNSDRSTQLTELRMQRLSYTLRSRPSWWAKYKDPGIRREWKTEALSQQILGHTLTEAEVEYVLDELAGYDKMRNRETGIQVIDQLSLSVSPSLTTVDC